MMSRAAAVRYRARRINAATGEKTRRLPACTHRLKTNQNSPPIFYSPPCVLCACVTTKDWCAIDQALILVLGVKKMNKSNLLPLVAAAFLMLPAGQAMAGLVPVSAITVLPNSPSAVISQTGSTADVQDGDLMTALTVTSSQDTSNTTFGFGIQLDFDISGLTDLTAFDFDLSFILDDPSGFDHIRIGVSRFSQFVRVDAVGGELTTATLTAMLGGAGAQDLSAYVNGSVLTIFLQTGLGSGLDLDPLILSLHELSLDVTASEVPLPAAFYLFALGLGAISWRGRKTA